MLLDIDYFELYTLDIYILKEYRNVSKFISNVDKTMSF